jgi:hypothetical protein
MILVRRLPKVGEVFVAYQTEHCLALSIKPLKNGVFEHVFLNDKGKVDWFHSNSVLAINYIQTWTNE